MKKKIEFKVLKKNKQGRLFILEPKERIKFRESCKYNKLKTLCEKRYFCGIDDGVLVGCTANVNCPRAKAWDKRHGLEPPYTMVENEYPDLRSTTFTWHPATESPGKRRVLMAFKVKGYKDGQYLFSSVLFNSPNVIPAHLAFTSHEGVKGLPVAWAYYDDIIKNIAPWMITNAEFHAGAWWSDEENK